MTPLRDRLRAALPVAMKARDAAAVSALRSALGAIDNAEAVAVDADALVPAPTGPIAGAVAGLGAAEVARRELTDADVAAIVAAEVAQREATAAEIAAAGHAEHAARLRAEAAVLAAHLAGR